MAADRLGIDIGTNALGSSALARGKDGAPEQFLDSGTADGQLRAD